MNIVVLAGILITVVTAIPVLLQLRKQPKGLFILFFAEMWERFSYYGMRGLLILYLTQRFLFTQGEAADHYGAYVALVYLTPLLGGIIADRWLGTRKAVQFGAILLVIGHLGLAIEGPQARQVLTFAGKPYTVDVSGQGALRQAKIMVDGKGYAFGASPDGGISVKDRPAASALPAVLPKGAYVLSVTDRSPLYLNLFYLALGLIIMGVGFMKSNIASIVGQLYPQGDPRRDPGFTLYYYGINLGAFWAGILCGLLGESVGWWAGFGLAGLGMAAGWLVFMLGRSWLQGHGESPDPVLLKRPLAGPLNVEWTIYLVGILAVGGAYALVGHNPLVQLMLLVCSVAMMVFLAQYMIFRCGKVERQRLGLALVLIAGSVVFWTLFEQAGTSLNLFADANTQLTLGALTVTAAQTQSFNPGFILIFAPIFSFIWSVLGRRGLDPNPVWKFGLALIQVGAGFLLLVFGAGFADASFRVPLIFLILAYLLHTTGELCLSPVGLSEVTKLSPPVLLSTMVAVWYLSVSWANAIGAEIAKHAGSETVGGQVLDRHASLLASNQIFSAIGWVSVGVGVLYLILGPFLKKWSHGANDPANHPTLATDHGQP